ncbi:hypothetical protein Nepgr_025648 [Nepenthes gracilis]|uniref:Uncharacterized protein n=1 Tax=Nepenthes gracilis TaxID=150966 RepID=A0AAD3Y1B9_NEPGR|nr:hypothetical protein Nepgr_025648 [Nepenthes gracilis]
MKGTSKVIMGATLVVVSSLAILLGLVLVLLAELYCSLLLRRRRLKTPQSSTATATTTGDAPIQAQDHPVSSPLSSFYSQGVLRAPRSILFPKLPSEREQAASDDLEKQRCTFHHFLSIQTLESSAMPLRKGLASSPSPSGVPSGGPGPSAEPEELETGDDSAGGGREISCGGGGKEQFVYISNPIYDNDANMPGRADGTPFETPDSSPSRLEISGASSGDDERAKASPSYPSSSAMTPPLTPMKELPAKACSIALRDARSLATSASDSNSPKCASSSSSGSPCTSPSW